MIALEEIVSIPLLPLLELRWRLSYDIPLVEEVESYMRHSTKQRIMMPHYCSILDSSKLVHFSIIYDENHCMAWSRTFIRQ